MKSYANTEIRNIAFTGHSHSGKTCPDLRHAQDRPHAHRQWATAASPLTTKKSSPAASPCPTP